MAENHTTVERIEMAFLTLTGIMLVIFLGLLFYASYGMGLKLPDRDDEVNPTEVRETPPFDDPGLHEREDGGYELVMLGSAWSFEPREVTVPAGEEITFVGTATDVIHGIHVDGTRMNAMLIPGQVTRMQYTFEEPGEYLFVCHEYCGAGHHLMYGTVTVE